MGSLRLNKNKQYPKKGQGILSVFNNPKLNHGIKDKKTAVPPKVLVKLIV